MLRNFQNIPKKIPLFKRSYYTSPPKAIDILKYGKQERTNSSVNTFFAKDTDDCYKCYDLVKKNNLSYLTIKNSDNCIIGILSRHDIKVNLLRHEYEDEEDEKIRETIRQSPH